MSNTDLSSRSVDTVRHERSFENSGDRNVSGSWVVRRLRHPLLFILDGLLVALVVCFVLLHTWGWRHHLNPLVDPISTFTSSAPGSNFGTACMILLGIIYITIAGTMMRRIGRSRAAITSGILLVLAGGFLFFVARYPTYYKPANVPKKAFLEQFWNRFFPSGDEIAKEERQRVIAAAHDDMIISSTACLVSSQFAFVCAFWRNRRRRGLALRTAILLGPTIVLFYGAFVWYYAGLSQRLGFMAVIAWILFVGRRFFTPAAVK